MEFELEEYMSAVELCLNAAGAEMTVYAEAGGYDLKGFSLVRLGMPLVYISTGMHGDEPAGPLALLELLRGGLLDRPLSFCFCPALNPTGLAAGTRENAQLLGGVDLNRDYLKCSSKEVSGHVKWLVGFEPELFISLHEDWESGGFYYYEINTAGDDPQRYTKLAQRIGSVMPMETEQRIDDHEVREPGWIYHEAVADVVGSWPEAIYIASRGCPLSFTFESPSSLAMEARVAAHVAAVNAVLDYQYPPKLLS